MFIRGLAADIQDRDGAVDVLKAIRFRFPFLRHVFAVGGYAGDKLKAALEGHGSWTLEIIRRSDTAKGFVLLPRRSGRKISARGIYRDPVRSSHGHFVKASGLRWLNFMVLTPVPWTSLVKALPILTLLEPSERSDHQKSRRHKLLTDWFRQGVLQIFRWLPGAILSLSATAPSPSMNSPMSSLAERHLPAACGLTPACTPRRTFKSGFNE